MIIEQTNISIPPGQEQQIGSAFAWLIGRIEVQPGCLWCRLFHNWHDSNEYVIQVHWATAEDLTNHLQSDAYKRQLLLMELSRVAPTLQFWTVQETRGTDLVEEARIPTSIQPDP